MFHRTGAALLNARAPHRVAVLGSRRSWAPADLSARVGFSSTSSSTGRAETYTVRACIDTPRSCPLSFDDMKVRGEQVSLQHEQTFCYHNNARQIRNHQVAPLYTCPFFNIVILVAIWHAMFKQLNNTIFR